MKNRRIAALLMVATLVACGPEITREDVEGGASTAEQLTATESDVGTLDSHFLFLTSANSYSSLSHTFLHDDGCGNKWHVRLTLSLGNVNSTGFELNSVRTEVSVYNAQHGVELGAGYGYSGTTSNSYSDPAWASYTTPGTRYRYYYPSNKWFGYSGSYPAGVQRWTRSMSNTCWLRDVLDELTIFPG
jgi:hypothetical protein